MTTISKKAFARAGLLGNPSDGYNGKTISLIVRNFFAEVSLNPCNQLTIVPSAEQQNHFSSVEHLRRQIRQHGYYGGLRLLKAAINRLADYCDIAGHRLHDQNFSISYTSNIPRQVGLAGSSAIVTATMRCLIEWYQIDIPPQLLASLVLSAESELGIPAGLQDRVIQAYEGLVYMNFEKAKIQTQYGLEFGQYEPLDPSLLPDLYIAYARHASQPTELVHNQMRERFQRGDQEVVRAMNTFANLAEQGKQALLENDSEKLAALINQNFDLRRQVFQIHPEQQRMIDCARGLGASAKFCGSGGAIIGTLANVSLVDLQSAMSNIDCEVILPEIDADSRHTG